MSFEMEEIQVIEMKMLDKKKYYPLALASMLSVRSMLYPFILIKTRLQIQRQHTIYKGTFDALFKIGATEGMSGLYRGFWVSCLQLLPSMAYISTYEGTRHYLAENLDVQNKKMLSFIGGGTGSVVGQTLAVPIDIVSQHLMLLGRRTEKKQTDGTSKQEKVRQKLSSLQHIQLTDEERKSRTGAVRAIIRAVYREGGVLGFYKGYFVSIACFTPNSALWWWFYDHYRDMLTSISPEWVPRLAIQGVAAPLGGISSAVLTNPLDVIRARIQVEGTKFAETVRLLWKEEGMWLATKGLSARLVQSVTFSFFIIVGYETVKRWSVLDEYKDRIRW